MANSPFAAVRASLAPLRRLSDAANRGVIALCVIFVLAMLTISFVGFFYMLTTGEALSWTYSAARLFVPWVGMLSISVAFKSGEHVAMNMLARSLAPAVAMLLQWLSFALIAAFALLLIWFGYDFFLNSNQYYMVSDLIQIHARWVAACVPVTGLVLLLHLSCGLELLEPIDPESVTAASAQR